MKESPEVKDIEAKMNGTIKFTRTSNEGKKYLMECQKLAFGEDTGKNLI